MKFNETEQSRTLHYTTRLTDLDGLAHPIGLETDEENK